MKPGYDEIKRELVDVGEANLGRVVRERLSEKLRI